MSRAAAPRQRSVLRASRGWPRRILVAVLGAAGVVWAAATLSFLLTRVIPGDPVSVMLGPQAQVAASVKARIRAELGLDRPLLAQYADTIGGLLHGDLGRSYQLRMPVAEVIGRQLGPTLQLASLALLFALVLVAAGILLGRTRHVRATLTVLDQVVLATPVFWIGLLLLGAFAFGLGWFPVSGSRGLPALVLPAVTLALPTAALLGQVLRDGIEQAEAQPFTETVRARGSGNARVLLRHTLRHGAVGAVPMAAYLTGSLLGGAVLVEAVFARPGLGGVALAAIVDRDLPVIGGVIVLSALVFTTVAVLSDLAVLLLDPRQRRQRGGAS